MKEQCVLSKCPRFLTWSDAPALLVLLLTGTVMAWWSWLSWPDPVIDFGRELYTPWQLLQGKVRYRDLMLFNGPLSQYFNALLFFIFGTSLRVLVIANLVILAMTVCLLYVMIRDVASRLAGMFGCLTFVLLFAFNQYSRIGNFNWITPYSHELTHGMALSALALFCAARWIYFPTRWIALCTGLVAGLVFLTKSEVFVACMGGLGLAWLVVLLTHQKDRVLQFVICLLGMLVAPLIAWLLLCLVLPARTAFNGMLGTWPYMFVKEHRELLFFKWSIFGQSLSNQLLDILEMVGWYALVILPWVLICMSIKRSWYWAVSAVFVAVAAVLIAIGINGSQLVASPWSWMLSMRHWSRIAFPWPLFVLMAGVCLWVAAWRSRDRHPISNRYAVAGVYTFFALLMMLKMLLNVRLWQYGFALALPAGVVLTVLMCDGLPALFKRDRIARWLMRCWMLVLWLMVVIAYVNLTASSFNYKQIYVGQGADAFRCYRRGTQVNEALRFLQEQSIEGDTMTVMPDAEIIAYLTRMTNPSPYGNYIPATLLLFSEEHMLDTLKAKPPTWIVLVHRDTREYGKSTFGEDYAQQIWRWIQKDYEPVFRTGAPPFNPEDEFGILIAKRREVESEIIHSKLINE